MLDERPSAGLTLVAGVQHVGHVRACPTPYRLRSECLNSVLGLGHAHDPIVGGKVPSYLGSSVAFIGPVLAATGAIAGGATTGNRARFRRRTSLLVLFRDDHPGYSTYETRVDQLSLTSRSQHSSSRR